jgi:hypothetical protein
MKRSSSLVFASAAFAVSLVLAWVWWRSSLPLPPLPPWAWLFLNTISQPLMPMEVHAQEELLGFVGIWVVVAVVLTLTVLVALGAKRFAKSRN